MTFHNVLAREGSSYCNRARLNFQAFALRDMKITTWEGSREVRRWVFILVFANGTVLALEETFLLMCWSSRAIILRFNSKTQWQMFLLLYGRHVCVPPKDTNMASPYKALQIWVTHFCKERANEKQQRPDSWQGCLYINHLSLLRFLTFFIEWLRFLFWSHDWWKPRIDWKPHRQVKKLISIISLTLHLVPRAHVPFGRHQDTESWCPKGTWALGTRLASTLNNPALVANRKYVINLKLAFRNVERGSLALLFLGFISRCAFTTSCFFSRILIKIIFKGQFSKHA